MTVAAHVDGVGVPASQASQTSAEALDRARGQYRVIQRREAFLGEGLFGDPAWNIMLDLFITEAEGGVLSVSALCIGARAPTTTALRYIALLAQEGLVVRTADARDARRSHVRRSPSGWSAMQRLLGD
jgi:hypothetical protein